MLTSAWYHTPKVLYSTTTGAAEVQTMADLEGKNDKVETRQGEIDDRDKKRKFGNQEMGEKAVKTVA